MGRVLFRWLLPLLLLASARPLASHSPGTVTENELRDAEQYAAAVEANHAVPAQPLVDGASPTSGYADPWLADFVKRSWEWHLQSTQIIFLMVLIVVVFGLVVSWMQFRSDTRVKVVDKPEGETGDQSYDLTASLQSVSVKSKTIGAVILVFSGIFFFLYISIVYPISVTSSCDVTGSCSGAREQPKRP